MSRPVPHASPTDDPNGLHPTPGSSPTTCSDGTTRANRTTCSRGTKSWHRSDRGAVTAELAIALPVLFSLLLLGIWSIGLVVLNIRCIDAARDVARAVARGEPPDQAKAIGHRTIPTGTITITRESSDIHVTVTATPTHTPPLLTLLTPTRLTATATLQAEPETTP
ncbi:TadE-like protein [Kribbella rubisoli]|uniref:TadE-like protein n=1 Tax=Kribbella rubisoli TaxID=3075929 RepID=A0A4Q7WW35_9ACTN|nr:TadE-like protein [Kribbella rubisoli]